MFAFVGLVEAAETQAKDAMGRDYWLYTPDTIDPEKTYTLVVGVHGAKGIGKGAAGHADWVNRRDVIVLGPSYPHDGYQYLDNDSDKQTLELFKALRQQYKLHDKLFIAGFSGGSQYAHRFAMKYPELVAGCAAHSGGTWATGDYYPKGEAPNPKAKGVLFVISCGQKDTGKSFDEAPLGRLDWAKKYDKLLSDGGYFYDAQWIADVGHQYSRQARQMTEDCFVASTRRLPEYEHEREVIGSAIKKKDPAGAWAILRQRLNHADKDDAGILGKAHQRYVESLSSDIDKIDRLAEQEVRRVAREHGKPEDRRAALEQLGSRYEGLPGTQQAIKAALAESK